MDELLETELHEATSGLGNWHQVEDRWQYLVNKEECITCLKDIQIALRTSDAPEAGSPVSLKLGEWKVLPNHLVPLFTAYREDLDISHLCLRVMSRITTRPVVSLSEQPRHLEHRQDYKEAFAKKDVFIQIMGMLVENMEEEEETEAAADKPDRREIFDEVLKLLRNLVTVPDPRPGDAGFTPSRRHLQLVYIKHFHDEGILDFFLLFAETIGMDQNSEHAWALVEIIYHICTHVNPEELMQDAKGKEKHLLKDLMEQERASSRLRRPQTTRHVRFGTMVETRDALGNTGISANVSGLTALHRGRHVANRDFRNPEGRNEKRNMFHDPFFVDLEEGSVKDHNQLNLHVRNALGSAKNINDDVLVGLRKFFIEMVPSSFSSLVSLLRSTLVGKREEVERLTGKFSRPTLLNFISWVLEFHRHAFKSDVSRAHREAKPPPVVDVASVQGALELDMLQFVAARLREFGKDSNIHASLLVIVLRTLAQQVKTVALLVESTDGDTKACGEILTQNLVKDDVMAHLNWIMKNFKSSTHDPRILSYTVEVFHHMLHLMNKVAESKGQNLEFQIERLSGLRTQQRSTTAAKEIAGLADARVVENLFHLLEKYKRHSAQLNSMLVKLIYHIIRAERTNIVVFFELSFFLRIHRMCADPLVKDRSQGKRFQEMVQLLQYILRQFFKCGEQNSCVFVELFFRKVQENPKEALLASHHSEFAAILDNYEDEEYKRILDRMQAGETLNAMRAQQKAALQAFDGNMPWTGAEDAVLQERYAMYADHPLFAELLAAELPEDSHRTARQVRKRLGELGLLAAAGKRPGRGGEQPDGAAAGQRQDLGEELFGEPAPKRPKLSAEGLQGGAEMEVEASAADFWASVEKGAAAAAEENTKPTQVEDRETLEMDLERLFDAAIDSVEQGSDEAAATGLDPATVDAPPEHPAKPTSLGEVAGRGHGLEQEGGAWSLEQALESMMDDEDGDQPAQPAGTELEQTPGGAVPAGSADQRGSSPPSGGAPPAAGQRASPGPGEAAAVSLEQALESMMDEEEDVGQPVQPAGTELERSPGRGGGAATAPEEASAREVPAGPGHGEPRTCPESQELPWSLEQALERMMDEEVVEEGEGTPAVDRRAGVATGLGETAAPQSGTVRETSASSGQHHERAAAAVPAGDAALPGRSSSSPRAAGAAAKAASMSLEQALESMMDEDDNVPAVDRRDVAATGSDETAAGEREPSAAQAVSAASAAPGGSVGSSCAEGVATAGHAARVEEEAAWSLEQALESMMDEDGGVPGAGGRAGAVTGMDEIAAHPPRAAGEGSAGSGPGAAEEGASGQASPAVPAAAPEAQRGPSPSKGRTGESRKARPAPEGEERSPSPQDRRGGADGRSGGELPPPSGFGLSQDLARIMEEDGLLSAPSPVRGGRAGMREQEEAPRQPAGEQAAAEAAAGALPGNARAAASGAAAAAAAPPAERLQLGRLPGAAGPTNTQESQWSLELELERLADEDTMERPDE